MVFIVTKGFHNLFLLYGKITRKKKNYIRKTPAIDIDWLVFIKKSLKIMRNLQLECEKVKISATRFLLPSLIHSVLLLCRVSK